jgi:O-acetyl-ADP-ribose deacetylase (regulator of RNase III)
MRFDIRVARIETLAVDAVVNAANRELLPGTGVDGALRRAAGPQLTQLTETMAAIGEGDAVITPGFDAPARHIIHTAAPIWVLPGDEAEKIAALGRCYESCVALAAAHKLSTIAFPCLGTGNFGWPRELACGIAIDHARAAMLRAAIVTNVIFCCFTDEDAAPYRARLG